MYAETQRQQEQRRAGSLAYLEGVRVGIQMGSEWMEDIRDMAMDVQIGPTDIRAELEFRFRSLRSPLSLAILGNGQTPVSPTFWRVPADADLAFYFPGARAEDIRPAAMRMWSTVAALEDKVGTGPALREVVAKLSRVFLTGGPSIIAHGPAPAAWPTAASTQDPAQRYRDARAAAEGWFLLSFFEPLGTWTNNIRALLTPPTMLRTTNPALGPTPSLSTTARSGEDFSEVPVRPSDGLPAGALHLVDRIVPNPAYSPRPFHPALEGGYARHIFIAGTNENTWFAIAESEGLARAKLLDALSGTSGGLARRPDLESLRSRAAGGIGFMTLRGLVALWADKSTTADLRTLDASMQAISTLLSGGGSPIFISFTPSGGDGHNVANLRVAASVSKVGASDLLDWFR